MKSVALLKAGWYSYKRCEIEQHKPVKTASKNF